MQKIIPHLWYDKQALEAAQLYTSLFPNSRITSSTTLHDTPSGDTQMVSFELLGVEFQSISAGPMYKLNPSVSFHITFPSKEQVDEVYKKLSSGGQVLMELGEYPFSERYSWVQDRYGLSWQLIYTGAQFSKQKITPVIMFIGKEAGRAEEAINLWTSVFPQSKIDSIQRRGLGEEPDREGTIKYASFSLFGQEFGAMDSAYEHAFQLNEAISFIVKCDNQDEIDHYWEQLSAVPEAEVCGWLKDKYGVSWQVVPTVMGKMLSDGNAEKVARVTQAFLVMKKLDIAKLEAAYEGK